MSDDLDGWQDALIQKFIIQMSPHSEQKLNFLDLTQLSAEVQGDKSSNFKKSSYWTKWFAFWY